MQVAMIVTWTRPVPGREAKALEYGADVMGFWGKQAADGKCTPPEWFFTQSNLGMWLVKGERDTLLEVMETPFAKLLMNRGTLFLDDFHMDYFLTGEAADEYLAGYGKALEALS